MRVRETDQPAAFGPPVGARLARDQGRLPGKSQSRARRAPTVSSVSGRGRHRQGGVTLIELIITIVITSVAVAGVVGAFSLVTGRSADPLVQSRATALGQLYLDEAMARPYESATPIGGGRVESAEVECSPPDNDIEDRENLGTVNDFNTGEGNFQDPTLVSQPGDGLYSGFEIEIVVACDGTGIDLGMDTDAKRIDVTVRDPRGQETTISAYRGNY